MMLQVLPAQEPKCRRLEGKKGKKSVAMCAGDRKGLRMASDLCGTAHRTAHCQNGSAAAHPLPSAPFLPEHTVSLQRGFSAFFMLPRCRWAFGAAGSAGFAGRLQGAPEVLPLPGRLLHETVHCLKGGVAFLCQPRQYPTHQLDPPHQCSAGAAASHQLLVTSLGAGRRCLSVPHLPLCVRYGRHSTPLHLRPHGEGGP